MINTNTHIHILDLTIVIHRDDRITDHFDLVSLVAVFTGFHNISFHHFINRVSVIYQSQRSILGRCSLIITKRESMDILDIQAVINIHRIGIINSQPIASGFQSGNIFTSDGDGASRRIHCFFVIIKPVSRPCIFLDICFQRKLRIDIRDCDIHRDYIIRHIKGVIHERIRIHREPGIVVARDDIQTRPHTVGMVQGIVHQCQQP